MDDFLNLLLIAAIYLFAAFSKSGKKKGKKNGRRRRNPMRSRAQGEYSDVRAASRDRQTEAGFEEAFQTRQNPAESPEHACRDVRQMHLHEVSQRQFADSAEGEDPCHVGSADPTRSEDALQEGQGIEDHALAQDVLRGVIMSEILARPQERAALRRGRR